MSAVPTIYKLTGQLTVEAVERLEAELVLLAQTPAGRLILDLHEVTIVTTPGIGLFLELHRQTKSHDGVFVVARPNANILETIRRTQLDRVFHLAETLDAALAIAAAA